jgi:hypothetical protein
MLNIIFILFVHVLLFIVIYIPHIIFKYKALLEIKTRLSLAAAQVTHAFFVKVFRLLVCQREVVHCVVQGHSFSFPFAVVVKDEVHSMIKVLKR